ncbi:aminopeptidase [Thecamonas trahens ATCC 50062]|uniref:Aminopeptidase n=1 Tax=Thecamonas trahens ATCC 50062 TaxID=461836 RepID=A0A0L0DN07_THETB|nr:aminopeptidase [Thecamonas trahens ATCC 50062]KNC53411.1 aminopeptidase [Thecamonas trahens ATCC 50062]|eukprot:XP_013754450.1 aminopeptidase [Thecamonas trahens ATCC 50062]
MLSSSSLSDDSYGSRKTGELRSAARGRAPAAAPSDGRGDGGGGDGDDEVQRPAAYSPGPKGGSTGVRMCVLGVSGLVVVLGMVLVALASVRKHGSSPYPSYPHQEVAAAERLPRVAEPIDYSLFIRVGLPSPFPYFSGSVVIDTVIKSPTSMLFLHAGENLVVGKAEWRPEGMAAGLPGWELGIETDAQMTEVMLDLGGRLLTRGARGKLVVTFSAALRDSPLRGLYLAEVDEGEYMAVTQFEPTDARRMFPCFDEPEYKAIFSIAVSHHSSLTALSNAPASTVSPDTSDEVADSNYVVTRFERTPRMSSYLVAIAVGELASLSGVTSTGVEVKAYAPPALVDQAQFALDVAVDVLAYYEQFFGQAYPLRKLDLLAVPSFAAGAMENWGLVTYRYSAMLVTPEASAAAHYRVALVVAHELAHQWFGNLVTMEWFNDLWLNEGFASYVQYVGMNAAFPAWKVWDVFPRDETLGAMLEDASPHTHPLAVPASMSVNEINSLFDSVSYGKGASVIRLLVDYFQRSPEISNTAFSDGLNAYLSKHAYGSATTRDLWESMSEASTLDIVQLMDAWTHAPGFPVVNIDASACATATGTSCNVLVQQERFLSTRAVNSAQQIAVAAASTDTVWTIPMALQAGSAADGAESFAVLRQAGPEEVYVTLPASGATPVVVGNLGRGGYYIVNYTATGWEALTAMLEADSSALSVLDKAGAVHDAFTLARDVQLHPFIPLNLVRRAFRGADSSFPLWDVVLTMLHLTNARVESAGEATLRGFVTDVLNATMYEVVAPLSRNGVISYLASDNPHGVAADGRDSEELRALVLRVALDAGHHDAVAAANIGYAAFLANETGNALDPALRGAVFHHVVATGGTADDPAEKRDALYALAAASSPVDLDRTLADMVDASKIPSQEFPRMMVYVSRNTPAGGRMKAYEFFKAHFTDIIMARYGDGGFGLDTIIEGVVGGFDTDSVLGDVRDFFTDNPVIHAQGSVDRAIDSILVNNVWRRAHAPLVIEWLREHRYMM